MDPLSEKRVVVVNYNFSAYRKAFMERVAENTKALTFICGRSDSSRALEDASSTKFKMVYVKNLSLKAGHLATFQQGALSAIRKERPDCIVTTLDPRLISNQVIFAYSRLAKIPVVMWGHGIRPKGRFKSLYRFLALRADAVLLYSNAGKKGLIDLGVPDQKLFVAYNSIDTSKIDQLRAPFLAEGRKSIVVLGRLIPEKKTDLILRAWALLPSEVQAELSLQIIGDGPDRKALEELASSLSLENVVFHGKVYEEEKLSAIFNQGFLSVSPGYVGLNAIHSMTYAVPMIYADNEPHSPEIEAVHENENGLSFRADDPADLAKTLASLVDDPMRVKAFSEASLSEIQRSWTIGAMLNGFLAALRFATR